MVLNGQNKRGFFLTMMALAILSFMLLTAQVWVQAFEQSDQRASQRFKGEAMRLVLATVSDKSFSDFANTSAFFATYQLVNYTADKNNFVPGREGLSFLPSQDPDNNQGTGAVNKSIGELMLNGTSVPEGGLNLINYTGNDRSAYTFLSWQNKIGKAAAVMGFNVTFSNLTSFNYSQPDAWHVNVYFEVQMNISDFEGTMRQNKVLRANSTFAINGFLDPMVTRGDMISRNRDVRAEATEKQIWKDAKYNSPADVAPIKLGDNNGDGTPGLTVFSGFGWFSGPITELTPAPEDQLNETELVMLKQYALIVDINDHENAQKRMPFANSYGAVIVVGDADRLTEDIGGGCTRVKQDRCLNCLQWQEGGATCDGTKQLRQDVNPNETLYLAPDGTPQHVPVIEVSSNPLSLIPIIDRGNLGKLVSSQQFILFDNENIEPTSKLDGERTLWDNNKLRDMATCGFYVSPGATGPQGIAPSFFQRMVHGAESSTSLRSTSLGIESFVAGQWAGGAEDPNNQVTDAYSRLDWEFYSQMAGEKVKGMPGCKDKAMCSPAPSGQEDPVITKGVGRFGLSTSNANGASNAMQRYGLTTAKLYCGAPNRASCTTT